MKDQINIYCDESCHLQNDNENVMALGAISCPTAKKDEIFHRIAELKAKYNLIPKTKKNPNDNRAYYEIKWNKVSKSQLPFFKDVIDYFFDDDDIGLYKNQNRLGLLNGLFTLLTLTTIRFGY